MMLQDPIDAAHAEFLDVLGASTADWLSDDASPLVRLSGVDVAHAIRAQLASAHRVIDFSGIVFIVVPIRFDVLMLRSVLVVSFENVT